MALVTRYFGESDAGDADGTSWANRAAFVKSGAWSTVFTGFDFSANGMLALIEGGKTYTAPANIVYNTTFTTAAPTYAYPLIMHGCDSSGNMLTPPDPDWVSAMPAFSTTTLPSIDMGSSYYILGASLEIFLRLVRIYGSRTNYIIGSPAGLDWTVVDQTGTNTSSYAVSSVKPLNNCVFSHTGNFNYIVSQGGPLTNCRVQGPGAGSGSGDRDGIYATTGYDIVGCTITGVNRNGYFLNGANASRRFNAFNNTITGCGGDGVKLTNSATATVTSNLSNNIITGNAGYAINCDSSMYAFISQCRMRDNTTGNINIYGNYPITLDNDVTDTYANQTAADTAEFVDASNGDYRIKASSSLWGKGYGAGDEIPTPAQIAAAVWAREGRSLTA